MGKLSRKDWATAVVFAAGIAMTVLLAFMDHLDKAGTLSVKWSSRITIGLVVVSLFAFGIQLYDAAKENNEQRAEAKQGWKTVNEIKEMLVTLQGKTGKETKPNDAVSIAMQKATALHKEADDEESAIAAKILGDILPSASPLFGVVSGIDSAREFLAALIFNDRYRRINAKRTAANAMALQAIVSQLGGIPSESAK